MYEVFSQTYESLGVITYGVAYGLLAVAIVALTVLVARLVEGSQDYDA